MGPPKCLCGCNLVTGVKAIAIIFGFLAVINTIYGLVGVFLV